MFGFVLCYNFRGYTLISEQIITKSKLRHLDTLSVHIIRMNFIDIYPITTTTIYISDMRFSWEIKSGITKSKISFRFLDLIFSKNVAEG